MHRLDLTNHMDFHLHAVLVDHLDVKDVLWQNCGSEPMRFQAKIVPG